MVYNDQQTDGDDTLQRTLAHDPPRCEQFVQDAAHVQTLSQSATVAPIQRVVWQKAHPRFWYISVVNCRPDEWQVLSTGSVEEALFHYKIELKNPGGPFAREFSVDHQGELLARLFGLALFAPAAVVMWWLTLFRFSTLAMVASWRALCGVVSIHAFAMVLYAVDGVLFVQDGVGAPGFETLARFLEALQVAYFTVMLLALIKGWTTSYSQLKSRHKATNLAMALLLVAGYTLVFAWESIGGVPASAFTLYDSEPGVLLICVRLLATVWFLFSARVRYRKSTTPEKRRFFVLFSTFGVSWFLSQPIVGLVAVNMPTWIRAKSVTFMVSVSTSAADVLPPCLVVDAWGHMPQGLFVNTLGYALLGYLVWPNHIESAFNTIETISIGRPSNPSRVEDTSDFGSKEIRMREAMGSTQADGAHTGPRSAAHDEGSETGSGRPVEDDWVERELEDRSTLRGGRVAARDGILGRTGTAFA